MFLTRARHNDAREHDAPLFAPLSLAVLGRLEGADAPPAARLEERAAALRRRAGGALSPPSALRRRASEVLSPPSAAPRRGGRTETLSVSGKGNSHVSDLNTIV